MYFNFIRGLWGDMYVHVGLSGNVSAVLFGTGDSLKKKNLLRSQISVYSFLSICIEWKIL